MTIKVGDLVCIVRPTPCCGNVTVLGRIFCVQDIRGGHGTCAFCGASRDDLDVLTTWRGWVQVNRLKRIPPLSELESEKNADKVSA